MAKKAARITGIERVRQALAAAGERGPEFLQNALGVEAFEIFAVSQGLVPVDTGRLRASGFIREGVDKLRWIITYGTVYALAVHEGRKGKSGRGSGGQFTAAVGGAASRRYLSGPFKKAKKGMLGRLAKAVSRQVKAGAFR